MRSWLGPVVLLGALGGGCALVLGFEETTLRPDVADGGPDDSSTFADHDALAEAGGPRWSADPSSVVLRRGASAEVHVTVDRGADVIGTIAITLSGLPSGVTAAPVAIAPAANDAFVKLSAAPNAPFGATKVTLIADSALLPPIDLTVLVTDAPGVFDVTFDGDGVVTDATMGQAGTFYALAVQPDGKILAAGAGAGATPGWFVRRFAVDGGVDKAFTTALSGLPADGEVRAIAIDPATGKILLAGTSTGGGVGNAQLTVIRRDASGAPDTTFAGGAFRFGVGDSPLGSDAFALVAAANGSVVVAGSRREIGGGESGVALRLTSAGARDPAFNGGNVIQVASNHFCGVALDGAGAVLLGGTDASGQPGSYWLSKRIAGGGVDTGFGSSGVAKLGLGFRARGFARLPDGSLVLAGDNTQGGNLYTMGRADANGTQVFVRGVATGNGASFYAAASQSDGRLVAVGHTTGANAEARVERVMPDGGVDSTFGTSGAALVNAATLYATAVQSDGRILAAGNTAQGGGMVVRLWP